MWPRGTSIYFLTTLGTDFEFFGNMSKILDEIGNISQISDIMRLISKKIKQKNIFGLNFQNFNNSTHETY